MITLGIDPGIATTGYGIIKTTGNTHSAMEYGTILTPSDMPLPKRLYHLAKDMDRLIRTFKPDAMAVEALFFNKNVKTALIVGQARGVIILSGENNQVPIYDYTPSEVKIAVSGYGKADKHQVQHMVKSFLKLEKIPKPDDVADALAIAICHSHSHKLKSLR